MITLAIESAILGGSVAVSDEKGNRSTWAGASGVSKAEDILFNLKSLLQIRSLEVSDVEQIVVSAGPGSFTGIRIGIATATGLATALNVQLNTVSLLAAMALSTGKLGLIASCVPVGRSMFCVEVFNVEIDAINTIREAKAVAAPEIESWIDDARVDHFTAVLTHLPFELQDIAGIAEFAELEISLAECILLASSDERMSKSTAPIFISKSTTA